MGIPQEVMAAPAGGITLSCLHQIALAPEALWQTFENGGAPDSPLPLAQRRGTRVWFTRNGEIKEIALADIRAHCLCATKQS